MLKCLRFAGKAMPRACQSWGRAALSPASRFLSTYYAESHEFVKVDGGVGTVGITAHAADALGDIVFVELPDVGADFEKGETFGSVESVKAASDVYTPVSGEVVEANEVNAKKEKAPPFSSPLIPPLSPALLCFAIKLRSRNLNQTLASSTSLL